MVTSHSRGRVTAFAVAAVYLAVLTVGIADAKTDNPHANPHANNPGPGNSHAGPGNPSNKKPEKSDSEKGKPEKSKPEKGTSDPALACAADKHKAAGHFCAATLRAWAGFEKSGDAQTRDVAIDRAAEELDAAWAEAEAEGDAAGIDCAAAFLTSSAAGAFIDSASGALVGVINDGLDLDDKPDARCGSKIVKAAAAKCQALFDAESLYQKRRTKGDAGAKRANAIERAQGKFAKAFAKATRGSCRSTATESGIEARVDDIVAHVVRDTLASPAAGNGPYVTIPGTQTTYQGRTFTPVCMDGSPYTFFARRGTVNKLVMYYQGGGACWEQLTCSIPTCDDSVTNGDNPNNASSGFADLANPDNPFRDWNAVFVSYCSCDIHFGDAAQDYDNFNPATPLHVEHRGYHNSKVAEKWAREHFLAPEEIFVTGSSAGAYGAWFNGPLLHSVWPSAHFSVLADAGNGVVTQEFLEEFFPNWNFEANLPPEIPELKQVLDNGEGIPGYTEVIARVFPNTNWAHYSTAFDGSSGGQTGFYNLMLHDNDPLAALTWWEGSCAFRNAMQAQAVATAAAVDANDGNYRYYIGSGSRHTMFGSNKVYTDTTGGVPTIVDWLNAMIDSGPGAPDPGWVNVEADPYNIVLPGDPRPNPLVPPFEQSGPDVIVNCPAVP